MTTLREKAEDTRDRLLGYISDLEDKLNSLKQILQKPIGEIVLNPCGVIQSHPLAIEKTATEFATLQEAIKLYG